MFDVCDKNQDKNINVRELGVCMNIIPNPDENEYESLNNKAAELMKVFDSNKDGSITMREFGKETEKVQDPLGDEEYVDVTMADGTIKKIHKSELFNNVKDSSKGFEMKNDKIYKEKQKNGNITELTEKDPALGNMIRIGKWAAGFWIVAQSGIIAEWRFCGEQRKAPEGTGTAGREIQRTLRGVVEANHGHTQRC
mmetsp:Transcript_22875/g.39534  ORF Transcript_22875/g.39534 Transcript_22875/m.39534 type:complete len:196 (-) Transcript_22875:330-917(-)